MEQFGVFSQLGQYEVALASVDYAIKLNPDDHEYWGNRGVALYYLNRFEEAIESYNRALELNPVDRNARINREHALNKLGEQKAKELIQLASFET